MASHVVGPFLIGSRQLESAERTLLDETAAWTFVLLESLDDTLDWAPHFTGHRPSNTFDLGDQTAPHFTGHRKSRDFVMRKD